MQFPEVLITSTTDGVITAVSRDALLLFGYPSPEDLIGQNVRVLVPSPYKVFSVFLHASPMLVLTTRQEQHDTYLATYAQTRVKKILDHGRVVEAQVRDILLLKALSFPTSSFPTSSCSTEVDTASLFCFMLLMWLSMVNAITLPRSTKSRKQPPV